MAFARYEGKLQEPIYWRIYRPFVYPAPMKLAHISLISNISQNSQPIVIKGNPPNSGTWVISKLETIVSRHCFTSLAQSRTFESRNKTAIILTYLPFLERKMPSCETCHGKGIKGTVCPTCGHPDPEAEQATGSR